MKLLLLLPLCMAALASGCRFWYKPVPVANAIGEERAVLAGDSVNVHRDDRFEVYGPSPEAVYDGYEQLNRAFRSFERHFGTRAPRLAFVLSRDSAAAIDSVTARSFRDREFLLVQYVRPRSVRSHTRYGGLDYGGVLWPIAPTAARVMLARFAEDRLPSDAARPDSALLDRLPLWYRAAVIHLVGDAGTIANDMEYVREHRNQWQALGDLLMLRRAASADSLLDPTRRSETDELTRIIAAQSSTFGRFLAEREGPAVIGRLGAGYLAGRSLNELISEFHTAPHSIPELERRWRAWIEARED